MAERIWTCKIGGEIPDMLPFGADGPMRQAVEKAFLEITGVKAKFTFSGWAGGLNKFEREIVEENK